MDPAQAGEANGPLMHRLCPPVLATLLLLGACAGVDPDSSKPIGGISQEEKNRAIAGTIHGNPKGFVLYSTKDDLAKGNTGPLGTGAPVVGTGGGELWQAALQTLDFMPLMQADSAGGVIITDWYAPPETPDERFKITVYVIGQDIQADALTVKMFKQVQQRSNWVDTAADPKAVAELESNILGRARDLRAAAAPS